MDLRKDEMKNDTIVEESLLNDINEKRLSHKILNKPEAASERVLDELDYIIK